jgi:ABC-type transport system substrate-binding protein
VWVFLALIAAGAGLVTSAGFAVRAPKKGGVLRAARPRDIDSVDPGLAYVLDSWQIDYATCAKLYNYPDKPAPQGAIVRPEVATGFPKVSKNGRTQTITLKRTYRFSNGTRVTAANFVTALNRDANPKFQSPGVPYLHEIVGADAVINGQTPTITGVRALGPYTLQIRTTQPLADLPSRLTIPFFCPVAVGTPPQEINDPLGSGPYYVASRVVGREVVLKRNPFYRGPRPANVDEAVWTIMGREACRIAVEQDQIDYCGGVGIPSEDYANVAAKYGINKKGGQFFVNPLVDTDYIAFNHDRPAFKGAGQIPLEKAINWAIDRPALVGALGYASGQPTDQILPPAIGRKASIYPLGSPTARDLAKARALFAKARFKPKQLVLYTFSFDPGPAQARIIQNDLKPLGIDVQIDYFPSDAFFTKIATRGEPFDLDLDAFSADYADPYSFFVRLDGRTIRATNNENDSYFNVPRYNRAIARANRLAGAARRKAFAQLDIEMMRNDPPWAPFENDSRRDFISKSLGCYVLQPVYLLDVAAACKK